MASPMICSQFSSSMVLNVSAPLMSPRRRGWDGSLDRDRGEGHGLLPVGDVRGGNWGQRRSRRGCVGLRVRGQLVLDRVYVIAYGFDLALPCFQLTGPPWPS